MLSTSVARAQNLIDQGRLTEAGTRTEQLVAVWPQAPDVDQLQDALSTAQANRQARAAAARQSAQIQDLLASASGAQASGKWLADDGRGALALYAQAQQLDAGNVVARTGIEQVLTGLRDAIRRDTTARRFDAARAGYDAARDELNRLGIDDERLLALGDEITEARAAEAKRQEEAAALATLNGDIDRYLGTARDWLNDDSAQEDARYRALAQDLAALLQRAPSNERLLAMRQSLQTRVEQLAQAAKEKAQREERVRPPVSF